MAFGDWIDGAIAPFNPRAAERRIAARARMEASQIALTGVRQYDAAGRGRRTAGWRRNASSADAEADRQRSLLYWAGHDLARNNKYAAAGIRQLTATIVGDGIVAQLDHPIKSIKKRAQEEMDRFAESKVDGFGDLYGHQKVSTREMIVGGEALTLWHPDEKGPNGRLTGMEGAQLDMLKTQNDPRIVQGVEFIGMDRAAYWLFEEHPYDIRQFSGVSALSKRVDAAQVDHLYERLRFGQTRGVSLLAPLAMTLRDIGDIEDAKRLQEKVQACLALIITPGEGQGESPLKLGEVSDTDPLGETMRPGMIARTRPGESVHVVNPQPSSNTVDFIRQQIAVVSANMVPYHLMTGDVSQANYSSLRASLNGMYAMVTDWQHNELVPLLLKPSVDRRMARLALETGDSRYRAVTCKFAMPRRYMVDPIKDTLGEIMEIRAGLETLETKLVSRGINAEDHIAQIKAMNVLIDAAGLALDCDPRRVTDSGILQAAQGYLAPRDGSSTAAN
jgi:lambda family phage portal protein